MSDFIEVIKSRNSKRKYEEGPLEDSLLNKVLEAVQSSQSWSNTQCWELVVIDDPEIRNEIQKVVPTQNPGYKSILTASVLIAVCGKKGTSGFINGEEWSKLGDWYMYDLGIATQNLCISAHALGLGTVVMGWFDHDAVKKIIELPDGYELVSLVPLGYPAHKGSSPKRKSIEEFVHKNKFQPRG